ncbi:hypothetical protein C8A01DRAFT_19101, partial [Parachaetomium inaequale]
ENGWIRIGPQPIKEYPYVRAASTARAEALVRASVRGNLVATDSKLPGNKDIPKRIEDLQLDVHRRFIQCEGDRVRMVCDYTGAGMSMSPSPLRFSLEAILPYLVVDGQCLYHALPNVCNIMISLNLLKHKHPILVLPLLGQYLRTHQEPDFERRKAVWTWLYTALYNVAIMNKIFHCTLTHEAQIEQWSQWDEEKQKEVLQHLRTGEFGPTIQDELASWKPRELFGDERFRQFTENVDEAHDVPWTTVYRWLKKIAVKYGLTHKEFEYYCTISTPTGRVFYPFHVLSRPQAEGSWGWHSLFAVARAMLERMRRACNKHAEAAGLGEDQMDPLRFIYWWAHHLCRKIQGLKREHPTLSTCSEEIAFLIVDRFGFPIVPWTGNVFKASLCKDQDHGIPMVFGLVLSDRDTAFDPVEHFDLTRCTITIDTQGTNLAMLNYPKTSWNLIPRMIAMVPFSHPFWRVHQDLGLKPWAGDWTSDVLPQRPVSTPTFDIPLISIDHWFNGGTPVFRCGECTAEFQSAGLLVHHYRQHHTADDSPTLLDVISPSQDQIDEEYWAFRDKERKDKRSAQNPCPYEGCSKAFTLKSNLDEHVRRVHEKLRPFECTWDGCVSSFATKRNLDRHINDVHKVVRVTCSWPTCTRDFALQSTLDTHVQRDHKDGMPCPVDDCGQTLFTDQEMYEHKKEAHGEDFFWCDVQGCNTIFAKERNLKRHKRDEHQLGQIPCGLGGCGEMFFSRDEQIRHQTEVHGKEFFRCDAEGCDAIYGDRKGLNRHKREKH